MLKIFYNTPLLVVILLIGNSFSAWSKADTVKLHADMPVARPNGSIQLTIYCITNRRFKGTASFECYKFTNNGDSILVLSKRHFYNFKRSFNKIRLDVTSTDSNSTCNRQFCEILRRTKSVAPGFYKIRIRVADTLHVFESIYQHQMDSVFSATSDMRDDINRNILGKAKRFIGRDRHSKRPASASILTATKNRVSKVARKRGLKQVEYEKNNKIIFDFFYEDWLAGRYVLDKSVSLSQQVKKQRDEASGEIRSLLKDDLDHQSLFSQLKGISIEGNDQQDIEGNIGMLTNVSNQQEERSALDNNYYELHGQVTVPISGLPIELQGLYNSQDAHRKVKSSYFRVHYDVNAMKDKLGKAIGAFNEKTNANKSKNAALEQLYGAAIAKLENRKKVLSAEIDKQTVKPGSGISRDTAEITNKIPTPASDEADNIRKKKDEVGEIERKISRYQALLEQNKNIQFFDSAAVLSKTRSIKSLNDASYKEMVKKGANLLPDGKASSVISGVKSFDLGMFSKSSSRYTLAGQQIKGGDLNYDFGACETAVTIGKIEYVGRDGNLDRYTCYSATAGVKVAKDQNIGIIYYGYSPDKSFYKTDDFFKQAKISGTSFASPIHVLSTTYSAQLSEYISVDAEIATSIKNGDNKNGWIQSAGNSDKAAYYLDSKACIPGTAVSLEGSFEKVGATFENKTLPITLSGIERYTVGGRNDFFNSLLSLGVEYNHLVQVNTASKASNTRWGIDAKTNFKRIPNIQLSYKPFAAFRSLNDTFATPQRPLFGSVANGKLSYNIKRQSKIIRLALTYNQTKSTSDSINTANTLIQGICSYSCKRLTNNLSLGMMHNTSADSSRTQPNKTSFISLSTTYMLSKRFGYTSGEDIGHAEFGFCRFAITNGATYKAEKLPVSVRVNFRYNTYKLSTNESWKAILSGMLDVDYNFKIKAPKKN